MQSTAYRPSAGAAGGDKWYYMSGGKKCGPVDASKLASMITSGSLPESTRVWTQGMANWAPAADTPLMNQAEGPVLTSVVTQLNPEEQKAPKRKSRWWIWLIVVLALGAAVAAAYFLLIDKNPETPDVVDVQPIVYGLAESTIFENEECAFIIDDIGEKGDYLELDVRCVNKTEDTLSFVWSSTCVNDSMFDPLWSAKVQPNATMRSSITFPLDTLNGYNLLPADLIEFVLRVHNDDQYKALLEESEKYIIECSNPKDVRKHPGYKVVEDYDGYLFSAKHVKVDEDKRPYFVTEDEENIYFDEIYDRNGYQVYAPGSDIIDDEDFYNDQFGRPYYFTASGKTVYYDGYGFAFYDETADKYYFYDEDGKPAYYGNGGIPEYYTDTVPADQEKPHDLDKAAGCCIVHKEFTLYPTGKSADEVTRPDRVTAASEAVYWNGEKGSFIVLGGEMDEFSGYIVHTYVENKSDSYIYFCWDYAVVNGLSVNPDMSIVLRPHSSAYKDIVVPAELLKENKIKDVERIDFKVRAVGENLSVPLYPNTWDAVTMTGVLN